jgi:uncharacterized protein
MLYEFNERTLYKKIDGLSLLHKIAFGASCCERLLPNYKLFVDNEGWGDFSYLEILWINYGVLFLADKSHSMR